MSRDRSVDRGHQALDGALATVQSLFTFPLTSSPRGLAASLLLAAALALTSCATVQGLLPGHKAGEQPSDTSHGSTATPSPARPAGKPADTRSPRNATAHITKAIRLMQQGQGNAAEAELRQALTFDPGNAKAVGLLKQITSDPIQYLGSEYFLHKVRRNESLSILAKRFLGDPLAFYILARYNGIENPSRLDVGESIKIPGKRPSAEAQGTEAPAAREEPPATSPPPAEAAEGEPSPAPVQSPTTPAAGAVPDVERDVAKAATLCDQGNYQEAIDLLEGLPAGLRERGRPHEVAVRCYVAYADTLANAGELEQAHELLLRALEQEPEGSAAAADLETRLVTIADRIEAKRLYDQGMQQVSADQLDRAYESFTQALVYRPDDSEAKHQLDEIRPRLVDQLHKEAMLLYRQQKLDDAIALWDRVLEIDPGHELATLYRARAVELKARLQQY